MVILHWKQATSCDENMH